jgi:hypothetical protein
MIIDVHTHLNNYDETKEVPLAQRLEQLQESMAFSNVDAAMILTSYTVNACRPSTREVVEITQDIDSLHVVAGMPCLS